MVSLATNGEADPYAIDRYYSYYYLKYCTYIYIAAVT
jgi:hypothetical protein